MTHDEMIAVIQAHAEGKQIEFRGVGSISGIWIPAEKNEPIWNFAHYDYRIRPEPKPDVVNMYLARPSLIRNAETLLDSTYPAGPANLRLSFSGETGELIHAEVLK